VNEKLECDEFYRADALQNASAEPQVKRQKTDALWSFIGAAPTDEDAKDQRVRPTNEEVVAKYMVKNPFSVGAVPPTDAKAILRQLRNLADGPNGSPDNTLLLRVALRYYHTTASSAPSERVWSTGTNTLTKSRVSLTGDNISTLVYVNRNQHLINL
jgi:hypothetical protein